MARKMQPGGCLRLALLVGVATAQYYPFCTNGIPEPEFVEGSSVDVIVAQAPLFSTNPKIGDKARYLNLYHASLVFAQGSGVHRRYWTLEFDSTIASLFNTVVPEFIANSSAPGGTSLLWKNDIRYCLTRGLLWGRNHWSQRFDVVFTLTVEQAMSAFGHFVLPVNGTSGGINPQYQLWRVVKPAASIEAEKVFVQDITCNQGVVWFFHYITSVLKVKAPPDFVYRGTAVDVLVNHVEKVDTDDPKQWSSVVHYFRTLHNLISKDASIWHRLGDLAELALEHKYVYDTNERVYYELFTHFPWISMRLTDLPLTGPSSKLDIGAVEATTMATSLVV